MKKEIILIIMILLSINILGAKEIGLNELIENFNLKSNYIKREKLELDKLKIEEKGNLIDKWRKLSFNITPSYNYYESKEKMPLNLQLLKDRAKYPGQISINLGYNMFYSSVVYDNTTDKLKRVNYKLGLSKDINDIIYSEQRYKDESIKLNGKLTKLSLKESKKEMLKSIIDMYVKIKDLDVEIKIKENSLKIMSKEYENLKRKLEVKEAVKLDIEYMQIEINSIKTDIEYLNKSRKNQIKEILKYVGLDYSDYKLKDIKELKIDKIDIEKDKLIENQIKIKLMNGKLKYYKRESEPNIKLDINYDIEEKVWNAGIVFIGNILEYGTERRKGKKDLEKLEIEKIELLDKLKLAKENRELEYKNLLSKLEVAKEKYKNLEKRYDVDKNIYEKGYMSLLDFLKSRKNRDEAKLNYEKLKNRLNGYRYKLRLR